jgi:hypothetical protein
MKLGQIVIVKNVAPSNGSTTQPAIVTRAWSNDMVNVTVMPDCGAPYFESSLQREGVAPEGGKCFTDVNDSV